MISKREALKEGFLLQQKLLKMLENNIQYGNEEVVELSKKLRELVVKSIKDLKNKPYAMRGKLKQVYSYLSSTSINSSEIELGHMLIAKLQKKMLKEDGNVKVMIVGGNGKGKSYSSIEFAAAVDPAFTVNNIIFSPEEFIQVIKNPSYKGSAYVWDESGVGFAAREFATKRNRGVSQILQTFRIQNSMFILTVPTTRMVDTHARDLSDLMLEAVKVYRGKKENVLRIYWIKEDTFTSKIYRKRPSFSIGNTDYITLNIRLDKMPAIMEREYKKRKTDFFYYYLLPKVKKLIMASEEEALSKIDAEKKRIANLKLLLPYVVDNPKRFGRMQKNGLWKIEWEFLMRDLDLQEKDAKLLRKWVEKELNGGIDGSP